MQDNKERLENQNGLADNEVEKIPQVMENQESLFGDNEVFTEAMVVEKEEISVDSSEQQSSEKKDSNGDTAIFTFSKDKNKKDDVPEAILSVADIEKGAKEYYDAKHAEDIQDKVKAIYERANSEFADNNTVAIDENEEQSEQDNEQQDDMNAESSLSGYDDGYTKKNRRKDKKKRRKGHVNDDDMNILSADANSGETLHNQAVKKASGVTFDAEDTDIDSIIAGLEGALSEEVPVDSVPDADALQAAAQEIPNTVQDVIPNTVQDVIPNTLQDEIPDTSNGENALAQDENQQDDAEKQLFAALGAEHTDEEEYLKRYEDMCDDELDFEYTSKEQENGILMELRNKAMKGILALFLTIVATIACFYFETAAVTSLPTLDIFTAGKFGVTYSMCMLQIMFLCVIFNLDSVKRAFKGLRPGKASSEGFTAAIISVCTLHSAVSCLLAGNSASLRSFCTVGCLALLFLSISSFFKAQTTLSAFCVAASQKPKFSCRKIDRNCGESVAFENYIDDESTIVTVDKSNFVEGFFKKVQAVPNVSKHSFKRICIALIVALVVALVAGIIKKDVYAGFMTFAVVSLTSLPVNALLVTSLPFFKATGKAMQMRTAFIGEAVCDNYDDTNVISFDDTEVFPPKGVKVTSIKTYENNRIDKVILYMAKVFEKIGGPLSFVFANSVQNMEETDVLGEVKQFSRNGITAMVDDKYLLIGNAEFMMMNGLTPVEDNIDETYINSCGSIMYMAVDGVLAAKFYIKYSINKEFEDMLHAFYDAGVCVGIKTYDPCITTELISGFLRGTNYPLAVISKCVNSENEASDNEKTDSAIVSLAGVHSFLKGFIKADKLRNIYRTNSGFSVVSMLVGIAASSLGMLFAGNGMFGVLFMVVFQLCWCLPAMIISSLSGK